MKKPPSTADFSFLLMASSSSNPIPDTAMASGGDPENPTADTETVVAGAIDGEGTDPSLVSPVRADDRENFVFPLLDLGMTTAAIFRTFPTRSPFLLLTGSGC